MILMYFVDFMIVDKFSW